MDISDKLSEEINKDSEVVNEDVVEAGLIDDLKSKLKSKSSKDGFFKSLLKSRRRIDTKTENKYRGNIVYEIEMCLLDDDDEPRVKIPAELRLEQAEDNKINMYLKLPDKNYSETKELHDIDTSEYQGITNSKADVGRNCWKLFNSLDYSKDDEFLSQFAPEVVDDNAVDFDSKNIKTITFEAPDPETGEPSEFQFKAIVEVSNKERTKVDISFIYPNPESVDDPESSWWENEDQYTDVDNDEDKILDKVVQFCEEKYNVSPLDWSPNKLTAKKNIDKDNIMSNKTMRLKVQKVEADEGYEIELKAVTASYSPVEAQEDLTLLISDPTFGEDLMFDETAEYDVSVTDDSLDYEKDEFNLSDDEWLVNGLDDMLNCAYILLLNCKQIEATACGKDMERIRQRASSYIWSIQGQIDTLTMWMVEYKIDCINPGLRIQGLNPETFYTANTTYFEDFYNQVTKDINCYLSALDLYSCNLPYATHHEVASWTLHWYHEINYFLERENF